MKRFYNAEKNYMDTIFPCMQYFESGVLAIDFFLFCKPMRIRGGSREEGPCEEGLVHVLRRALTMVTIRHIHSRLS